MAPPKYTIRNLCAITIFLLVLNNEINNSPSGMGFVSASSTATAVTTASPTTTTISTNEATKQPNVVVQLGTYIRDSFVRLKDGTAEMYSNHKTCNEIRTRDKLAVSQTGHRGISYAEFDFLQKGKDDRLKLGNILFMMFFAPNFVPYAFMFFPNMLPGPLSANLKNQGEELERLARLRTHTVLKALTDIERLGGGDVDGGVMGKLNPFGKGRALKAQQRMVRVYETSQTLLSKVGRRDESGDQSGGGTWGEEHVLNAFHDEIYTPSNPSRERTRLVIVPKPLIEGLSLSLGGSDGGTSTFLPHFMKRGKVLARIAKIAEADEFLASEKIDWSDIRGDLLHEACLARFIGTQGRDEEVLRRKLETWVDLTVTRPQKSAAAATTTADDEDKSSQSQKNKLGMGVLLVKDSDEQRYFNGNLARVALMCFSAVDGARGDKRSSTLPRILFSEDGALGREVPGGPSSETGFFRGKKGFSKTK